MSTAARFAAVTKRFRDAGGLRTIFAELSFAVPRGKVTILSGPSGSGKTTVLNLLAGLEVPDSGDVWLEGVALTALDDRARTLERRSRIGYVFQFFNLVPTLDVLENVRLPLELNGLSPARANDRARFWLRRVGLVGRERAFPNVLSGGEQQRVALARALVHAPVLVLADEPTGNLDPGAAEEVLALFSEVVRNEGKTLVLATHSARAASLGDQTVSLEARSGSAGER